MSHRKTAAKAARSNAVPAGAGLVEHVPASAAPNCSEPIASSTSGTPPGRSRRRDLTA